MRTERHGRKKHSGPVSYVRKLLRKLRIHTQGSRAYRSNMTHVFPDSFLCESVRLNEITTPRKEVYHYDIGTAVFESLLQHATEGEEWSEYYYDTINFDFASKNVYLKYARGEFVMVFMMESDFGISFRRIFGKRKVELALQEIFGLGDPHKKLSVFAHCRVKRFDMDIATRTYFERVDYGNGYVRVCPSSRAMSMPPEVDRPRPLRDEPSFFINGLLIFCILRTKVLGTAFCDCPFFFNCLMARAVAPQVECKELYAIKKFYPQVYELFPRSHYGNVTSHAATLSDSRCVFFLE